jgi:cell volume regulation protein A
VPIVLATFPVLAGVPHSDEIFNIVFFIVISSVLLQGTTIPHVARWLGAQDNKPSEYHFPHEFVPQVSANSRLIELIVAEGMPASGRSIIDLGLPAGVLVVSIRRDGMSLVPSGGTVFAAGDHVMVLAEDALMETVRGTILGMGSARGA